MPRRVAFFLVLLALVVASCRPADPAQKPGVDWRTCRLPKLAEAARCTMVKVPADRDRTGGPTLDLHVAVLPAVRPTPRPDPLFFVAGGPGQAASAVASTVLPSLRRIRRDRDLVFVDVRGTGRSGGLDCQPWEDPDEGILHLLDHRIPQDRLDACRKKWTADLTQYRTRFLVDDLEQVAGQLGWQQVNVYGVSYGTRVGLTWLARHPERIRALVLDGAAPFAMRLFEPFARDAEAAWRHLVADCRAAPACHAAFPDLATDLARLLERFSAGPKEIVTEHPLTGAPLRMTVTAGGIALAVRGMMYSADLQALLPMQLRDALAGDYRPLLAQILAIANGADESTSLGMMLSVVCSEDVDRFDMAALPAAVSGTYLGPTMVQQARSMCTGWPRFKPQKKLFETIRGRAPSLLISGAADPVTPARWADLVAGQLPNSRHVIAKGAGHGAGREACTSRIVAEFVASGSVAGLDLDCVAEMRRPPFFIRRAGTAP